MSCRDGGLLHRNDSHSLLNWLLRAAPSDIVRKVGHLEAQYWQHTTLAMIQE